jgi:hypothetical protein
MNNRKLQHLIHQLKGKSYPESLLNEFRELGMDAFNLLLDSLIRDEFEENQAANTLEVLQGFCLYVSDAEKNKVFQLALDYCGKDSIKLRDTGSSVVVGMVRMHRQYPDSYKLNDEKYSNIVECLNHAISKGLNKEREEYVNWFLQENID